MIKIDVINTKAQKVKDIEVPESVFGAEFNEPLIHQVIVAQLANKRQGTKSTLTRSEVRGGGIKPWRQKGTGRARQGSIRSPQWIKGGVVFAPKPRDFSKKVNKKMKTLAICSAISKKFADGSIIVVDNFNIEAPKTKYVSEILKTLNVAKRTLLVLDGGNVDVVRASRNIEKLKTIDAELINVYDVVQAEKCILTEQAVKTLSEVYANE